MLWCRLDPEGHVVHKSVLKYLRVLGYERGNRGQYSKVLVFLLVDSQTTTLRSIESFYEGCHCTFATATLSYHGDLGSSSELHINIAEHMRTTTRSISKIPILDRNRLPMTLNGRIHCFHELRMFPYNRVDRLDFGIHLHDPLITPGKAIKRSRKSLKVLIEDDEITRQDDPCCLELIVSVPENNTENEYIYEHIG